MTEPRKRSPAEVWRALEKAGADAELERIDAMSGDEVDAELRAAGMDPADAAKIGEDVLAEALANDRARAPARPPGWTGAAEATPVPAEAPRDRRRIVWIAAIGVAAVIIAALLARPKSAPWNPEIEPPRTPEQKQAAKMRDDAIGACEQGLWSACEDGLNAAKALDPAGEIDPRVIVARKFIAASHGDAGHKFDKPPKP